MKFRPFYLSAALALVPCKLQCNKKNHGNSYCHHHYYIAKKADLTETQLKRWSHLDLLTDTVPGMSVDRAYRITERPQDKK